MSRLLCGARVRAGPAASGRLGCGHPRTEPGRNNLFEKADRRHERELKTDENLRKLAPLACNEHAGFSIERPAVRKLRSGCGPPLARARRAPSFAAAAGHGGLVLSGKQSRPSDIESRAVSGNLAWNCRHR